MKTRPVEGEALSTSRTPTRRTSASESGYPGRSGGSPEDLHRVADLARRSLRGARDPRVLRPVRGPGDRGGRRRVMLAAFITAAQKSRVERQIIALMDEARRLLATRSAAASLAERLCTCPGCSSRYRTSDSGGMHRNPVVSNHRPLVVRHPTPAYCVILRTAAPRDAPRKEAREPSTGARVRQFGGGTLGGRARRSGARRRGGGRASPRASPDVLGLAARATPWSEGITGLRGAEAHRGQHEQVRVAPRRRARRSSRELRLGACLGGLRRVAGAHVLEGARRPPRRCGRAGRR